MYNTPAAVYLLILRMCKNVDFFLTILKVTTLKKTNEIY